MWNVEDFCSSLTLPLFLSAAWGMSNLHLSRHLDYKLSLAQRYQMSTVRKFWFWDLLLSVLAFVIIFFILHGRLFAGYLAQRSGVALDPEYLHLLNPVAGIVFGLFWPTLATVSIKLGKKEQFIGIGELRRGMLGGGIESINTQLHEIVDGFIRRVVASTATSETNRPLLLEKIGVTWKRPAHPTQEDLLTLETTLRKQAHENLERLRVAIAGVEMIPLIERNKPLMSVPGMTFQEEEQLFEKGVGVAALIMGNAVPGFDETRWTILRQNARALVRQRVTFVGSLSFIFAFLFVLSSFIGPLPSEGTPPIGVEMDSPTEPEEDPAEFGDPGWSALTEPQSEDGRSGP